MSLDLNSINEGYQNVMGLRLGTGDDPSIRDLAKANTSSWKGKVVQFFRNITGNGISKENNTRLVNRAFGEGMFKGVSDEQQLERQNQIEQISDEMQKIADSTPTNRKVLADILLKHHLENSENSVKQLKNLEKKMEKLALASEMLCGKCKFQESEKTNQFAKQMSNHSSQFLEVQKTVHDVRKLLEENEKVISELKAIPLEQVLKATNSSLNKEFIRFYVRHDKDQEGPIKPEERPKIRTMIQNQKDEEVQTKYQEFLIDYVKGVVTNPAIREFLKTKLNEPQFLHPIQQSLEL